MTQESTRRPAVYDCFTFSDEWLLLELRLRILADSVDHFVLVESDRTFRGERKELHASKNVDRIRQWSDRVVVVQVLDAPENAPAWERERHQRAAITRGLHSVKADDLVVVADVDEIPSPAALQVLRENPRAVSLEMAMYYYRLNLRIRQPWLRAKVVPAKDVGDPHELRSRTDLPVLPHGGWHFSYLGGDTAVSSKLATFSHSELDRPLFRHPLHIDRCQRLGTDLFGRYVLAVDDPALPDLPPATRALGADLVHPGRSHRQALAAQLYAFSTRYSRFSRQSWLPEHPARVLLTLVPLTPAIALKRVVTRLRGRR